MSIAAQSYVPRNRSRVKSFAERNDLSESTVWRWIRAGKLKAYKPSPGITLVDDVEGDNLIAGEAA